MNRSDLGAWIERTLPEMLPAFLPERRWFAGKAHRILDVALEDSAWLPDGHRPCALVMVRVRDASGEESRYTLIVGFDRDTGGLPIVGRVDCGQETAWAVEAANDRPVALALLRGFASSGDRELPTLRGGALRYGDSDQAAARGLDAAPDVHQVGAEQSNTTLRIDRTLAFKLLRRLEYGENPELEMGRFLTRRTSFQDLPLLRGSLTYVSAHGQLATVGVLQDWIESRGDGWGHVVGLLRQRGDEPAVKALRQDARALGVMTERLHRALASDSRETAFASEAVTAADIVAWRQSVVKRTDRAKSLVQQHMASWSMPARRLAGAFLERSGDGDALPGVPDQVAYRFQKIRVHGDYHLGQTLRTQTGFVVIDFEGEPARPLAERRAKQPALKDVAGMLRSFDYAVETALGDAEARDRSASIAQVLRQCFLDGYRATFEDSPPAFAPADPVAMSAWIDFFELDKALYEVEYEINNRPAWVRIPLRGLVRIMGGRAERGNDNA
jgi:maltose alpha-D-glucosyltransferase/alpha-amylase